VLPTRWVLATFCGSGLCELALDFKATDDVFRSVHGTLVGKYGPSHLEVVAVSPSCPIPRKAGLRHTWFWNPRKLATEAGNALLIYSCPVGESDAHLLLFYRNLDGLNRRTAERENSF